MASKTAYPETIVSNPKSVISLPSLDSIAPNKASDESYAVDLHTARKNTANAERMRYEADIAEHRRDKARIDADTAATLVDIAAIKNSVTKVRKATDEKKAVYNTTSMQNSVGLAADRANNSTAALHRATQRTASKGITLEGTDYSISLPSWQDMKG